MCSILFPKNQLDFVSGYSTYLLSRKYTKENSKSIEKISENFTYEFHN